MRGQAFNKNVLRRKKKNTSQGIDASFVTYADNRWIDLLPQPRIFTVMNDLAKVNKKDDSALFAADSQ